MNNGQVDTVIVLLVLFLVVSAMNYFKVAPDERLLAAILLALTIKPQVQAPGTITGASRAEAPSASVTKGPDATPHSTV